MKNRDFLRILLKKWRFILAFMVIVTVASFVLTIAQTPEYKTSAQLLVIQENRADMDSYTAAKSAEQITNTFSKVIYTGSFMQRVFQGGYNVKDDFGDTSEKKLENWEGAINVATEPDTGFLRVEVYREDRGQSWLLASAITDILTKNNSDYHGGGDKIQVSIVDPPTISDKIARPSIWRNTVIGAVLGLVAGIILVAAFKDDLNIRELVPIRRKEQETISDPEVPIFDEEVAEVPQESISQPSPIAEDKSPGAPPAGLPIVAAVAKDVSGEDQQPVKEGEKVEVSSEEMTEHWLNTGEIKK